MWKRIKNKLYQKIKGISNEQLSLEANLKMGMKVGKNVSGLVGCTIDHSACWLIEIGDNVVFAPQVYLLVHDTSTKKVVGYTRVAKLRIGNNCFIGARAFIMPGVSIGENSIVGSNSVVTKDVPENVVVAGNPAKIICTLEEYKNKIKMDYEQSPSYDFSYTVGGRITETKKAQMLQEICDNGYVK